MSDTAQQGGRPRLLTVQGRSYQGVEVLMLHRHHGVDTVVLFKTSSRDPSVGFAGGRVDTADGSLEHTIERELFEESKKSIFISRGLFREMTRQMSYVDYEGDNHMGLRGLRRCYVCRVPTLSQTTYDTNKNIMELIADTMTPRAAMAALGPYFETSELVHVPVTSMDSGRARVQVSAQRAYAIARRYGLIQRPFVLTRAHHSQVQNNNIYRGALRILRGTTDRYR